MSRDWKLRVEDILAAAERATRFVGEMDLAAFKADERTASAVLHQIFLIGEAATRLPEEIRNQTPDIPWEEIIGMRNIIAHGYFEVDLEVRGRRCASISRRCNGRCGACSSQQSPER